MKPRNDKEVKKAVLNFSAFLVASIIVAIGLFSFFLKTSSVEVKLLMAESDKTELLRTHQVQLTERIDSLYFYTRLLNSDDQVNFSAVINLINQRKLTILSELEQESTLNGNAEGNLLYKKLLHELDSFTDIRNSIRMATLELNEVKDKYFKCLQTNKDLSQKLYMQGR